MTRLLSLAIMPLIMLSCTCSSNTESDKKETPAEGPAEMLIALSFDDGPNDVTTPQVLDILEEFQVPASFFVIGQNINDDTAKQMTRAISLGCEIQNHSYTHGFMTQMSKEEIEEEIRKTDEQRQGWRHHSSARPDRKRQYRRSAEEGHTGTEVSWIQVRNRVAAFRNEGHGAIKTQRYLIQQCTPDRIKSERLLENFRQPF